MRVTLNPPFLFRAAVAMLALGLTASCSSHAGSGPASSAPSATIAPSSGAPASTSPAPGSLAGCDTGSWQSVPVTVSHPVPVPPVPVVTAIRAGAHPACGYDRIVLDVSGKLPGYTIRYVDRVIADPSGQVITVPGARFLLVTLRPTQAHKASGQPTVSTAPVSLGLPILSGYAVAGDFEGVVTVAIGLRSSTGIRVGELPGHLFIDFRR